MVNFYGFYKNEHILKNSETIIVTMSVPRIYTNEMYEIESYKINK